MSLSSIIRYALALDSTATDGAGKTGLVFGNISAKYVTQGGTLTGLTCETITTLGTYQAPSSAAHIRIKELDSADPTKGVYEIHFHDTQLTGTGKTLWLFLSASGAAFQPLEVDLVPFMGRDAQSADDLKDFADVGYDPAAHGVEYCKTVTTVGNSNTCGTVGTVSGNVEGKILGLGGGVFVGVGVRAVNHADANLAVESVQNTIAATVAKLDTAMELDGAVYRYTTNALEQGPAGGGGSGATPEDIADEVQTRTIAAVASVAAGGITAASFAANSVDAAALATDAVNEIQTGLATSAALTTVDSNVIAIKAKTDNLPTDPADASVIAGAFTAQDTEIAAIKAKTDNLPADPADASDIAAAFTTVNNGIADLPTNAELTAAIPTTAQITIALHTTQMTESYAADGVAPSLAQAVLLIQQLLTELSFAGVIGTIKKLDGVTPAATLTINEEDEPTSITRSA